MSEEVYPSNSHKVREASLVRDDIPVPMASVENVPKPATKQRSLSPVREIFKAVFPGGFEEIKENFIWEVFVPWIQDALHDAWESVGDVLFPGSPQQRVTTNSPNRIQYNNVKPTFMNTVSYNYLAEDGMRPFPTKKEAEDILEQLRGIRRRYSRVTLLDFNEAVGNQTTDTQASYGWTNLDLAYATRSRGGGWVIKMPPAAPLD